MAQGAHELGEEAGPGRCSELVAGQARFASHTTPGLDGHSQAAEAVLGRPDRNTFQTSNPSQEIRAEPPAVQSDGVRATTSMLGTRLEQRVGGKKGPQV